MGRLCPVVVVVVVEDELYGRVESGGDTDARLPREPMRRSWQTYIRPLNPGPKVHQKRIQETEEAWGKRKDTKPGEQLCTSLLCRPAFLSGSQPGWDVVRRLHTAPPDPPIPLRAPATKQTA